MSANESYDDRFYSALKKSQPLAFLASFSMVTAVFSATNLPEIYNNAVMATVMFLISFMLSFSDQFFPHKDPSLADDVVRHGKFFFFVAGVLALVTIAIVFADQVPEIVTFFYGWIIIGIGISFITPVITKSGKFQTRYYTRNKFKLLTLFGYGSGGGFIFAGLTYIMNDFSKVGTFTDEALLLIIGGFVLISIVCIVMEVIIISKFRGLTPTGL